MAKRVKEGNINLKDIPRAVSYISPSAKFKFILDIIAEGCNVKETYNYFENLLIDYTKSLVDNKITAINNKGKKVRITITDIDIKNSFDCIITLDTHSGEVYCFGYFPIEYITNKGLKESNILEIDLRNKLRDRCLNSRSKAKVLKIKGFKNKDLTATIVNSCEFI